MDMVGMWKGEAKEHRAKWRATNHLTITQRREKYEQTIFPGLTHSEKERKQHISS